jgi:hypothetical protein
MYKIDLVFLGEVFIVVLLRTNGALALEALAACGSVCLLCGQSGMCFQIGLASYIKIELSF